MRQIHKNGWVTCAGLENWREPTSPSSTSIPSTPALPVTCEYISVSPTTTDNAAVFAGQVEGPQSGAATSCNGWAYAAADNVRGHNTVENFLHRDPRFNCQDTLIILLHWQSIYYIHDYSRMFVSSLNYRPRLSKQPTQSMSNQKFAQKVVSPLLAQIQTALVWDPTCT